MRGLKMVDLENNLIQNLSFLKSYVRENHTKIYLKNNKIFRLSSEESSFIQPLYQNGSIGLDILLLDDSINNQVVNTVTRINQSNISSLKEHVVPERIEILRNEWVKYEEKGQVKIISSKPYNCCIHYAYFFIDRIIYRLLSIYSTSDWFSFRN
jgi:hypothetical protein